MLVRAVSYNPALNPLSATHSGVAPPSIVDGDAQNDGDTAAHHPPPPHYPFRTPVISPTLSSARLFSLINNGEGIRLESSCGRFGWGKRVGKVGRREGGREE